MIQKSFTYVHLNYYFKIRGTRLGRQELEGCFLDDNPDALWKRAGIDNNRLRQIPKLSYAVVGVDPAVTRKEGSDDTGIIVAGKMQMDRYTF